MSEVLALSLDEPVEGSYGFYSREITKALNGDAATAAVLNRLMYRLNTQSGIVVNGIRWIWNTYEKWEKELYSFTPRQIRYRFDKLRALGIVEVKRLAAPGWWQENYYTVNLARLVEFVKEKTGITLAISELTKIADQDDTVCQTEVTRFVRSYTKSNSIEDLQRSNLPPDNKDLENLERERNEKQNLIQEEDQSTSSNDKSFDAADPWQEDNNKNTSSSDKGFKPKKKGSGDVTQRTSKVSKKAPWRSLEERDKFHRDLVAALPLAANSHSPEALAKIIVKDLEQGKPNSFWDDWKAGKPIGTSTKGEWEAAPGVPYPKFVNYLTEKLIYPAESREQAQFRVGKILKDKTQALLYWKDFKRIVEALRQDADQAASEGKQVALPVWFVDRADISLERAAESANKVSQLAPDQRDWVEKALPKSEKAIPGVNCPSLPATEEVSESEEDNEDFCFNGYIDLNYLKQQAKKVVNNPNMFSLLLGDFRGAFSQATQNQKEIIRKAIAPIYPKLLDFL